VVTKIALPLAEVPARALEAVAAAERSRARTVVVRDGQPVAAIVPVQDLEKIEPPDPGASGRDRMLDLCGQCQHDEFVASLEALRSGG
jgi:hypothetical protein